MPGLVCYFKGPEGQCGGEGAGASICMGRKNKARVDVSIGIHVVVNGLW